MNKDGNRKSAKVRNKPLSFSKITKLADDGAYVGSDIVKRVTEKLPIGGYIVGMSACVSMVGPKGLICSVPKTGSFVEDYKALAKELGLT